MKKISMLLTVLCMLLTACTQPIDKTSPTDTVNPKGITKDEANEILDMLIPEANELYGIFWGGFGYEELSENTVTQGEKIYVEVINQIYKTTDDMKEVTENIFTKEFAEKEFYFVFDDTGEQSTPAFKDIDGRLYQNENRGGKGWGRQWLTDTLVIKEQSEYTLILEMDVTQFDEPDGKDEVVLKYIDNKWLIDSPLY